MPNDYFQFKQFTVYQNQCSMKVSTDACLFGAIVGQKVAVTRALDIGTGTGLLSLMFAQLNPSVQIDAIEIDTDAAQQASENVSRSTFAKQITVINEDILQYNAAPYDIIFCNPPFYENDLKSPAAGKNLAWHSTHLTLAALLQKCADLLKIGGKLFLLLPYFRINEVHTSCKKLGLCIRDITYIRKSEQHQWNRVVICIHKHNAENCSLNYIQISNKDGSYTQDFTNLLRDFYIKM